MQHPRFTLLLTFLLTHVLASLNRSCEAFPTSCRSAVCCCGSCVIHNYSRGKGSKRVLHVLNFDGQEGRWRICRLSFCIRQQHSNPETRTARCFILNWNYFSVVCSHPSCRYSTALNEFPSCCQVWLFSCRVLLWFPHRFFFWTVLLACFYKLMVRGGGK